MSPSTTTDAVVKNRFLGFLIWQSILSSAVFVLFRVFLLVPPLSTASVSDHRRRRHLFLPLPSLESLLSILVFNLSAFLFSSAVSLAASPQPHRPASTLELALALLRFLFVSGGPASSHELRRRIRISLSLVLLVAATAVSGLLSVVSLCGWLGFRDSFGVMAGLVGLAQGCVYGVYFVFKRRWVLEYPIIQRPLFFSFKMGIPRAAQQALKLSSAAYLISMCLVAFLSVQFKNGFKVGEIIVKLIIVYIASFVVSLSWELVNHLYQVLHTKRFVFAPPKGSAAAETNPSEHLLAALEESSQRSLVQYLAYLDLCMVCDNNIDTWRRAAFFEETGETYKRVVASCLRPLELFAANMAEDLESCVGNTIQLSNQIKSPIDLHLVSKFQEIFNDFQLCAWCAQAAASLTAHSHEEDRYGVAQLSGSNAAVISTLLSCLLAVETLMGKKTNLQSQNQLMGPAGIKWAALQPGRKDPVVTIIGTKRKGGPLHSKAYAMADTIRTSIYCIVSAFHDEMHGAKTELLEKDWVISSKPLYGTRELLVQKLRLFIDFQAC